VVAWASAQPAEAGSAASFREECSGQVSATFPTGGQIPGVTGSIFHPNRLICAPWSRPAYGEHGGPHSDWGGQTNWTSAATGYTKADTLADMLSQIAMHLAVSPGMS
jgi:hypothetical protein